MFILIDDAEFDPHDQQQARNALEIIQQSANSEDIDDLRHAVNDLIEFMKRRV